MAQRRFLAGCVALSAAATQFVAWRVGYHPALGPPWIGHVYPPWEWIEWQQAPWATNARSNVPDRRMPVCSWRWRSAMLGCHGGHDGPAPKADAA